MSKTRLLFAMVAATMLIGIAAPTPANAGIIKGIFKVVCYPFQYPFQQFGKALTRAYRETDVCHSGRGFDFELLDSRGVALYPLKNEIGINGGWIFRFGVSAETINNGPCTKLVPSHYIFEWNGMRSKAIPINRYSEVSAGRTSPSGWSGFLTIMVFYQEVRVTQNQQRPWQTHQDVRVMTEPIATKTYTVYFW